MPTDLSPDRAPVCGVNVDLLDRLICPVTRTPLELDRDACELISHRAGLAYPIRDGLPILLEEEARKLEDDAP